MRSTAGVAVVVAVAVACALAGAVDAAPALSRSAYCGVDPSSGGAGVPNVAGPPLNRTDLRLVQSIVVIRHGDRTVAEKAVCWPSDTSSINCTLAHLSMPGTDPAAASVPAGRLFRKNYERVRMGNCNWGRLTDVGYRQQVRHGSMLRDAYTAGPRPLLPAAAPAPGDVFIHSDDVPRTVLSVESLYTGLYPMTAAPDGTAEIVEMYTTEVDRAVMFPNTYLCPPLEQQMKEAYSSPEFKQFFAQKAVPVLEAMSGALGFNVTLESAGSVFDCLHVHNCHSLQIPAGVTQELFDEFSAVASTYSSFPFSYPNRTAAGRLNMGPLFRLISEHYQKGLTAAPDAAKLVLFPGHDTTLWPMLIALGVQGAAWPPYASLLAFELYESSSAVPMMARVVFNGGVLDLPDCGTDADGLCDAQQLGRVFESLVPSRAECPNAYTNF